MPTHNNTKRKEQLWAKDPHCHWCGILTINCYKPFSQKKFPRNLATVDHVYSRLDPRRRPGFPGPTVLACYGCNQRRCWDEVHRQPRIPRTPNPPKKPREYITQNSLAREAQERALAT